jgi:membrane fusion protein, multidrug efflux system
MRHLLSLIALTIVLHSCSSKASEPKIKEAEKPIPVKLISIKEEAADNIIHVSGYLSTQDEVKLSFKTGGVIEKIFVKEGDKVRKGQLLASIKSTEISAQVQQVQLAMQKAERDYQRVQNLYKDSVATLEQLQNAKTGLDIAKQNLSQASFNQQYSKIYATQDGFIIRKLKNDGELSEPGGPVLVVGGVSNASAWILATGVSDKDWAMIEKGNDATVSFEAFPGKKFPALVSKRSLAADPADGSFGIELQINFGKEQPATGMFGKASITSSSKLNGYRIPYESLLEANGNKGFVFASNDGRSVKKVEVVIGQINNNSVQVTSGLEGFAYVVSSGSPYLNDESTITVIK